MTKKSSIHPKSEGRCILGSSWWVPGLLTGLPLLIFVGGLWKMNKPRGHCGGVRYDLVNAKYALEMYRQTSGSYPTTEQGLNAFIAKPTCEPVPPQWSQIMTREILDPWKRPYAYRFPGTKDPSQPEVYSMGVDGIDGTDDDIHLND